MNDERGSSYEGAAPGGAGAGRPQLAPGEKRVALVIGNGRYANERDVLKNPENDATALAAALSRIGFTGVQSTRDGDFAIDFSRPGVDALLDLDHRTLGRALAAMTRACSGVTQAVIYYAGHGIEVNGENHIIPVDAKLNHISDARFETHALSVALSAIEGASGLRLVILDACRNNPFRARLFGARDLGGGLRSIEPPSNVLVAYAAKHGTTASDGGQGPNSPFATALLRHIETPGLEIIDLFREIKDDVLEATSHEQEPYVYGSLGRRREFFVKARDNIAVTAPHLQADADDRLWARIEGSEQIADYEFYLEHLPDGRHAPLARFEIRRLVEAEAAARQRQEAEAREREAEALSRRHESDWQTAEREDTATAYERFLAAWTSGPHVDTAHKKIAAVRDRERPAAEQRAREEQDRREGRIRVPVGSGGNDKLVALKPGESLRDLDVSPEMVLVPPGKFWMGSKDGEGDDDERPRHEVTIGYPLLVGKFPVTFAEWDAAVAAGGVTHKPGDLGWGRGRRPVINVSWDDAKAYSAWLSETTGKTYRLLSEAEWEYACRAGTETAYSFGDTITKSQAQFSEGKRGSAKQTVEVGKFPANAFGLYDMHGNVFEWCEDAWHNDYTGAPNNGSARTSADTSVFRVLRGGSWINYPQFLRAAIRYRSRPVDRGSYNGFRLARTLNPSP